jgi:hypothetical protein
MFWNVEFTDQFEIWWESLTEAEQDEIDAVVALLQERGPGLGRPLVDGVHQSRFSNMKELRLGTTRILFAFDPRRVAILLIGGDKRGNWTGWYQEFIPVADRLYEEHLDEINERPEKRE